MQKRKKKRNKENFPTMRILHEVRPVSLTMMSHPEGEVCCLYTLWQQRGGDHPYIGNPHVLDVKNGTNRDTAPRLLWIEQKERPHCYSSAKVTRVNTQRGKREREREREREERLLMKHARPCAYVHIPLRTKQRGGCGCNTNEFVATTGLCFCTSKAHQGETDSSLRPTVGWSREGRGG